MQECLIGHLLGDGYMTKNTGKSTNARFGFSQSTKKQEYFSKVFSNFMPLCNTSTIPHTKFFVTNDTNLSSLNFSTIRLPCLNHYYELFYGQGKRNVPVNIMDLLTPISLAYWIMDDGSKQNKGMHLNVYAFDKEGVNNLIETLSNKYGFVCSIHYHALVFIFLKDQYLLFVTLSHSI